jgi:succinate dehydrogenase subunit D
MRIPLEHQRTTAYRRDGLWITALIHRVSGVLLACFLPLHFLALGLAIDGEARLDSFLHWTQTPLVKLAEAVLVFLLTIHLLGGLRVLVIETLGWQPWQKQIATGAAVIATMAAVLLLIQAL